MPIVCNNDPFIKDSTIEEVPFVGSVRHSVIKTKSQIGFTLIELLITITIAAVLFGIAIPNFREFIMNSRIVSQSNDILADLATARSEAVKRNYQVVLCPTINPAAALPACDGIAGGWETGWLIFQDTDANSMYSAGDILLRIHGPIEGNNTLRSGATLSPLAYKANGVTSLGVADYFRLCDSRGSASGRAIMVEKAGRARVDRISNIGGAACP